MQTKTLKGIERKKKRKVNALFAVSFFLSLSIISFSLIGCGSGGGGGGGVTFSASGGTVNPALFSGWEMTNGPYSGSIASVGVDPQNSLRIFVAPGRGGLFLSEDGGLNWAPIEGQLLNKRPIALAISATDPNVIYVGTEIYGVYKSPDGGATWDQMSNGLPLVSGVYQPVELIVIDPTTSDVAYAFIWSGYFVYKTEDGGQNWFKILDGTGIPDTFVSLIINPDNPEIIYASCFFQAGVWKSEDGGDTWVQKNNGLPEHIGGYFQTRSLGIDPNNPDQVYVGMFDYGLYTTDNGGESWYWAEIFPGPARRTIESISVDPNDSSIMYVGVCCAEDISMQGLWKTEDNGGTWKSLLHFEGKKPYILEIAPTDSATVLVHTGEGGLEKRINDDQKWEKIDDGLVDTAVKVVSNFPLSNNPIYAGTESEGVFVTTDGGSSWTQRNNGLTDVVSPLYISALAVDLNKPQKVYVGTYDDGVFFTNDGGEVWKYRGLSGEYVQALAIYLSDSDVAYVGTRSGIFKTEDAGKTWADKNTGLTDLWVRCLAMDPGGEVLYAGTGYQGTSGRVFKTTNAGDIWEDVSNGLPNKPVRSLAVYLQDKQIVYAAFKGEGVYLTRDGSTNWVQKNNGLTSTKVISLAISQSDSKVVYAGTEDEGVFATIDGGDSWVQVDVGLTSDLNRCINAIAMGPKDEIGYAGTGCGVFKAYK